MYLGLRQTHVQNLLGYLCRGIDGTGDLTGHRPDTGERHVDVLHKPLLHALCRSRLHVVRQVQTFHRVIVENEEGDGIDAVADFQVVDDYEVHIGDDVMIGPNVLLCVTGHPLYHEYRLGGTQFSLPIHIGNRVWIGAGAMIMPGVTIGDNSVIGAGSLVTKDIPANVLAYGSPCRVIREIGEYDKKFYRKDMPVNDFK